MKTNNTRLTFIVLCFTSCGLLKAAANDKVMDINNLLTEKTQICTKSTDCGIIENPCNILKWYPVNMAWKTEVESHMYDGFGGIDCVSADIPKPSVKCIKNKCLLSK